VIDGFVWDETFYVRAGTITRVPQPAYCDRAMLRLVEALTAQVHAADPQKVFLTADCIGAAGFANDMVGYAMMADGTYQDTGCVPQAWPYGLFPAWRNVLWGCNWSSVSGFCKTHWGVEHYGVPVAISNGWGDDIGPSKWKPNDVRRILALFRRRLARTDRVRYLTEEPATMGVLRSDPIPAPVAGEVNWALAARGAKAAASSVYTAGGTWQPSGLIDGRRDTQGWGAGHGWASGASESLPQWVEIDFPAPRDVSRFVIVTYHGDTPGDSAAVWGVTDYEIQSWDAATGQWKTVAKEDRGRAMMTRMHQLRSFVRTAKFRVLITGVAADDGLARLLQVEAWGKQ
jgi:hypothetical protein